MQSQFKLLELPSLQQPIDEITAKINALHERPARFKQLEEDYIKDIVRGI